MKKDDTIRMSQLTFRNEWEYCNHETGTYYKSGVIPGKLLFSEISGNINPNDPQAAQPMLEAAYRDGNFSGLHFIRIVDYSRVKKEASIGFGIRAGKPLVRSAMESINLEEQEEEPVVQKRKRGGSVVERNPYNYTAKAI